jgi:hypothetical protein
MSVSFTHSFLFPKQPELYIGTLLLSSSNHNDLTQFSLLVKQFTFTPLSSSTIPSQQSIKTARHG